MEEKIKHMPSLKGDIFVENRKNEVLILAGKNYDKEFRLGI